MPSANTYRVPDSEDELRQFGTVVAQAFSEEADKYFEWLPSIREQCRVMTRDGEVVAGLVYYDLGQFFGGRSVPCWGVTAVAVSPPYRGRGVGGELMREYLSEVHTAGIPLSTLYPATQPVYRRLGWELAGARPTFEVDVSRLSSSGSGLEIRALRESDEDTVRALYRSSAAQTNGNFDRCDQIWSTLRYPYGKKPLQGYLVEENGQPAGYIYFVQDKPEAGSFRFRLAVRDMVFRSEKAGRRLLELFAHHRSVVSKARMSIAANSPLLYLTHEGVIHQTSSFNWMLRLVDVRAALEQRGWQAGAAGAVELKVVDDSLDANNRSYRLTVEGGRSVVEEIDRASLQIDVRGLAALYSSMLTPVELRAIGYLRGDDRNDELLQTLFSGPAPWMPEIF